MQLYVYRAYEYKFCGLHNLEKIAVIEAKDKEDAEDCAKEAAYDIIMNNDCIFSDLYNEANDKFEKIMGFEYDSNAYDERFSNILNKLVSEDVAFKVFELSEDATYSYSIEELQEIAEEDIEEFVADYAAPIFE